MHRSIFGESLELLLRGATRDEQLYADRVRQGFTTDEIALDLDCSRGTVFNVRKRLRQRARGLGLEIKNIAS